MTIKLNRTDDGYEALDRFDVGRTFRQARRGPNDRVADGWQVTDRLTGATWRSFTLGHVKGSIEHVFEIEDNARGHLDDVVGWRADVSYRSGIVEAYLALQPLSGAPTASYITVDGTAYPLLRAGSIRGGDQERSPVWVRQLLAHLGLPEDLPRI